MLDAYLNNLDAEEKEKTAKQARFGAASVEELAKMAGVNIGAHVCTNCGDSMQKLGSVCRCSCGMVKKAMTCDCGKKDCGCGCGGDPSKCNCAGKKKEASVELTKEAHDKLLELFEACDQDIEKMAMALHDQGMDKEAIFGALGGLGRGIATGAKALGKGQVSRAGRAVAGGAKRTGRQLKGAYQQGAGALRGAGPLKPGQIRGGGGVMGGAAQVAKQNPMLAAGVGAGAVGAAGYGMGKASSAEALIDVGDAAGRLLAKTAMEPSMGSAPIPMDELRESIEEAQGREDVPGRAKRWQIGGGVGGGVAGAGAGYGAGRLIGPKAGLIGAGIGAAGGALGGQALGKEHGAEEARADKAISMLRAMRAHQTGAMSGYGAGMRRGYSMGGGGAEKMAFSVTSEGHEFDAKRARLRAGHAAKQMALSQRAGAMGSAEGRGSILKALRGFTPGTYDDPRHQEYVARKHEAGGNAWNPFGGTLTPSSQEEGGSSWRYGKFKQPDDEAEAPAIAKAASLVRKACVRRRSGGKDFDRKAVDYNYVNPETD